MRIEIDEKELVEIIRQWCHANLGINLYDGKDIRISSKSYHSLAAVVTIEDAPIDSQKET
jgi:hypothetical protein